MCMIMTICAALLSTVLWRFAKCSGALFLVAIYSLSAFCNIAFYGYGTIDGHSFLNLSFENAMYGFVVLFLGTALASVLSLTKDICPR